MAMQRQEIQLSGKDPFGKAVKLRKIPGVVAVNVIDAQSIVIRYNDKKLKGKDLKRQMKAA